MSVTGFRHCAECGAGLSADARFCPECGAPVPAPEGVELPPQERSVPWRAREGIAIYLLAVLATAVGALPLAFLFDERDDLVVAGILLHEVLLLVIVLAWAGIRYGAGPAALGLRRAPGNVSAGLATALGGVLLAYGAGAVVVALVEMVTGAPAPEPKQIELEAEPAGLALLALGVGVVILAPVAEELFFRGFLYQSMRRWAEPWPAAMISGAVFAAVHILPMVLLPIFILGVMFARVVERTRSVVPAILAHMAFNAVGFLIQFVL